MVAPHRAHGFVCFLLGGDSTANFDESVDGLIWLGVVVASTNGFPLRGVGVGAVTVSTPRAVVVCWAGGSFSLAMLINCTTLRGT